MADLVPFPKTQTCDKCSHFGVARSGVPFCVNWREEVLIDDGCDEFDPS